MQMSRYGVKRGKLDHIFISHLHGDHFFGLMGLLTSMHLNGRKQALHIFAPLGLDEIIATHFRYSQTQLGFEIVMTHITAEVPHVIFENSFLSVETIPLLHRIPTTGFLFREKPGLRKIVSEKITEYSIPTTSILRIKQGEDFTTESGVVVPNDELTIEAHTPRSYAYCSDTAYTESFVKQVQNVSLLYHEATFMHEHAQRAEETLHSTTKQAAAIAQRANVGKLLIGHFSARYDSLQPMLREAREVFSESYLAEEGLVFHL